MNNKQDKNRCYVFSIATLNLAVNEWMEFKNTNNPADQESHLIVATAISWFLKHINKNTAIYTFTHDVLLEELEIWKSFQVNAYPHQKERINNTCVEIIHFFESEIVSQYKMTVQA